MTGSVPEFAADRLPESLRAAHAVEGPFLFGTPAREKVSPAESVWFWHGGPVACCTINTFRWFQEHADATVDGVPTAFAYFEHASERFVVWCRVETRDDGDAIVGWPDAVSPPPGFLQPM